MHHAQALDRLKQGNTRFAAGIRWVDDAETSNRRKELAQLGQQPFAMVLGCADARVPAEMIFDCGLGELFVVRVAGNIVAPSLIGSLEFAAEKFGTELCVVMGHSQCGAIAASINAVTSGVRPVSDNVQNIVLEVAPSVRHGLTLTGADQEEFVTDVTWHNILRSVAELKRRSSVMSRLVAQGRLQIVGALYDLHSGVVTFRELESGVAATRRARAEAGTLSP